MDKNPKEIENVDWSGLEEYSIVNEDNELVKIGKRLEKGREMSLANMEQFKQHLDDIREKYNSDNGITNGAQENALNEIANK